MNNKQCAACGATKNLDEFYFCRRGRQNKDNYCKLCRKSYNQQRYENNREDAIEQSLIYQQQNIEKYKKYQYEYRKSHKRTN